MRATVLCCLSLAAIPAQPQTPIATCAEYDAVNQVMIAHFGYSLPEDSPGLTVPVGSQNAVTPVNARVYGQTTVFRPGSRLHSFLALQRGPRSNTNTITWTVNGQPATVHSVTTIACPQSGNVCWDANHSGVCELESEDLNRDGRCTVADCAGPPGDDGPSGPPGANGLPGIAGPQGPTGDPAFPATFRLATVTSPTESATVSCNAAERLVSGGAVCAVANRTTNAGRIATSQPNGLNAWEVTCSLGQATAVAVCAPGTGGNRQ